MTRGLFDNVHTVGPYQWDLRSALDPEEERVFRILQRALGKENAMTRLQLAQWTHRSDRQNRLVVESLRKNHRLPIGALAGDPGGYFICVRPAEFLEMARREYRRNRSGMRNLAVFAKSEQLERLLGQLDLELGMEEKSESDSQEVKE